MKATQMLIGLILFSMFIVGAFSLIGEIYPSYSSATNYSDSNSSYNVINNITSDINIMQNQTTDSSSSDFGFALGAWQAVKLLWHAPSLISSIVNAIAIEFGIPSIFISGFLAIIGIIVAFIIIGAVFRKSV